VTETNPRSLPPALTGVLLTGASSEIGKVLADRFAARGEMPLVLTSNVRPIHLPGGSKIEVLAETVINLTDPSSLDRLKQIAAEKFRGPFALVHCVGPFWHHKPIDQCSIGEAQEFMNGHYLTLYGALWALLPLMKERGGGRVLAVSCTSVGFHYPEMAAFTSSKAAVESLVKCAANEWAAHKISLNAIALSTVSTATVNATKPLAHEERYITPLEVASLVEDILFASSSYISGNVIRPLKYSPTYYNRSYFERNPSAQV
jgi:NAD(P)-dependent dehydrogenase (short-subunit alcohol dehydrogenase family)